MVLLGFYYVSCYSPVSVHIMTGATDFSYVTNRSGRPVFSVNISTVETETVHATNVTDSAVLQTVTVAVQLTVG